MAKFTVGARVIDLLGRQQVAGTPTAISELFKNAHDAYADHVQVDLFRARDLIVLRDDGIGMTKAEFQTRWLVAATDSKRNNGSIALPPPKPGRPKRPVMGEKGIGRLAIALLGPQVLVLTRSEEAGETGPVTACLINWRVFSLPGIALGDIDVALAEIPAGTVPRAIDVERLVNESVSTLLTLRARTDGAEVDSIVTELKGFRLDPIGLAGPEAGHFDLTAGFGTHFYIAPSSSDLAQDIDGMGKSDQATALQKSLIGFNNTMLPDSPSVVMTTSFNDHKPNTAPVDLIGDQEFFRPDEFAKADHHLEGKFDERGQFSGTIKVFNGTERSFQTHWPDSGGKDTRCGPFKLDLAYVQGNRPESLLSEQDYNRIVGKLNKFGGLYIYRDGMRILPYGDVDHDFLGFENRRLRGAAYYFFSYRRMFGVIDISREKNGGLVEKAGREGFQDNTAYKQFRSILEHFFVQTAATFFRRDGSEADEFFAREEEIKRHNALLDKRRRQVAPLRQKLASDLKAFLDEVANGAQRRRVEEALAEAGDALSGDRSLTANGLKILARDCRESIEALDAKAKISKPRAVGLTRDLSHAWARYEVERKRLVEEVFGPAYRRLDEVVREAAERADVVVDKREDTAERLNDRISETDKVMRNRARRVRTGATTAIQKISDMAADSLRQFEARATATLVEFEKIDFTDMPEGEFLAVRTRLETELEANAAEQATQLDLLVDQIERLGDPTGAADTLEALETELEDRRERETESLRLAQMGQAIGIVHHEFQAVTRSVSSGIRNLGRWVERNPKLGEVYRQISESYAHLDSYLGLFAPLNRRLNQRKRVIDGLEISQYLQQLLGERMRRHGVTMEVTPAFEKASVEEYASTVFPCFVNIADNAVFWMDHGAETTVDGEGNDGDRGSKVLTLDHVDGAFVVSDTGSGILPVDEGAVFESGFSRKPGGSGLGLYITRSLLQRSGFKLTLDPYVRGRGATFRIEPPASAVPQD